MLYHAVLVYEGNIDLISHPMSRSCAIELVKYWKHNRPIFADSFIYSKVPAKWKKQIEAYIENEKKMHIESEVDPDELPFS